MDRAQLPPVALDDPDAIEVMSVWLAQGAPHVSLQTGWGRREPDGNREPDDAWGFLLADIAHHVANALAQSTGYPAEYNLKMIQERFNREIENPSHTVTGEFVEGKPEQKDAGDK